jgi:hypothetical protein
MLVLMEANARRKDELFRQADKRFLEGVERALLVLVGALPGDGEPEK